MTGISNLTQSNAITHPAPTGLGLKSKKISDSGPLPEVQAFPLSNKYTAHGTVPMKSKLIGEGATAIVKLYREIGKDKDESAAVFAVKEFRKKSSTEKEEEYIFKVKSEFLVSKSLHHPNVVETADLCIGSGKRWCHVMEYCPGGDLFSLIKKRFMKESEKLCCFKQLLRGVAYLHKQGIAHRDIKPENLLMSSDGHLKITDFGVSERFVPKELVGPEGQFDSKDMIRSSPGICGSEPYLPPEVLAKNGNSALSVFEPFTNCSM
jgi:protein-serine/threonine kinase